MAISIDHGPGKLEIVDSWKVMISMIGYLNMEAKCWRAARFKDVPSSIDNADCCSRVKQQLNDLCIVVERCSEMYRWIAAIIFLQGDFLFDQQTNRLARCVSERIFRSSR